MAFEVDERHQRHCRLHQGSRQTGQPVEVRIGRGVEHFQPAKHRPAAVVANDPQDIIRKPFLVDRHVPH